MKVDYSREFFKNISKHRILSREEEQDLLRKTKEGSIEARNTLVEHNLRLVLSRAYNSLRGYIKDNRYRERLEYNFSLGVEGLHKGIEKYSFDKLKEDNTPHKLSTYAINWIDQAIQRGNTYEPLLESEKRGKGNYYVPFTRVIAKAREIYGQSFGVKEIREILGKRRNEVRLTQKEYEAISSMGNLPLENMLSDYRRRVKSLNSPLGNDPDEGHTLEDKISSKEVGEEISKEETLGLEISLLRQIQLLSPIEREIINAIYFSGGISKDFRGKLGSKFGISGLELYGIEKMALIKLRDYLTKENSPEDLEKAVKSMGREKSSRLGFIDPVSYYNTHYSGLSRSELFHKNPSLYRVLRTSNQLDIIPMRKRGRPRKNIMAEKPKSIEIKRQIVRQKRVGKRDWDEIDPVKYYQEHYQGISRGKLKLFDDSLYQTLRRRNLLESLPIIKRDLKNIDTIELYRREHGNIPRLELQRKDSGLYRSLRLKGQLGVVPRAQREKRSWKNVNLLDFYKTNYAGLTRSQLLVKDPSFYHLMRKKDLIKTIPSNQDNSRDWSKINPASYYKKNYQGKTKRELYLLDKSLYLRLLRAGMLDWICPKAS